MRDAARAPEKSASLTAHVSWLMLAKTLGYIFNIALPLVLVRQLDQVEFGLYKQVFLVATTAAAVLPLGFTMSAYYYLPREPERARQVIFNIQLFNGAVGLLALLALSIYPGVLQVVGGRGLSAYGPLIGGMIFLWMWGSVLEVAPVAVGEVKLAARFIVAVQFSRTALFLAAAVLGRGVTPLLWAGIVQGLVQDTLLAWYLQRRFPGFWTGFDKGMLRRQVWYALPLGMSTLLYNMQTDLHNYVVSNRFGPALFARYAVGGLQLPLMGLLQEATAAVLIPQLGKLQQRGEHREVIQLQARAMRKLAMVYLAVAALLLVVGREFLVFLFTEQYRASWPVFAVHLLILPLSILPQDPLFRAYSSERFWVIRYRLVVLAFLSVALWAGISWWGLTGAMLAVVASFTLDRALNARHFAKLLGVQRKDVVLLKDVGKLAMAAGGAALAAAAARALLLPAAPLAILLVCGVVFAAVYGALALALRVPTREEWALVRSKFRV